MDNEEEINSTFDEINATIDYPTRQLSRELFRAFIVHNIRNATGHTTFPMTYGDVTPDLIVAEDIVDRLLRDYGPRLWPNRYHDVEVYEETKMQDGKREIRKSMIWYVRCVMGSQGDGPTRARSTMSEPDLRRVRRDHAWVDVPRNDSCEQRLQEEPLPWMREHLDTEEQRRMKRYKEADGFLPADDDGLDHDNEFGAGFQTNTNLPVRTRQGNIEFSDSDIEDVLNDGSDESCIGEARALCQLCGNWFEDITALNVHHEKGRCDGWK